jgi:hypothetical protein
MSHVANAALPVAVALLVLTAIARAVLWARIEGEEQRIAAKHLEALSTWCLIATGTYALAIAAAGKAGVLPLGAAVVMAAAAVLLRTEETTDEPERDVRRSPSPETLGPDTGGRRAFPETVPVHGQTPRSLWDEPSADAKRTGLWSR